MSAFLQSVSIAGFRSIRELSDFPLGAINVLVGANGAGKSNFVEFFRMLRAIFQQDLQGFVVQAGGGDGMFFEGPQMTPEIAATLAFGINKLRLSLSPVPGGDLIIRELGAFDDGSEDSGYRSFARAVREARIDWWDDAPAARDGLPSYLAVSRWIVYHFHDTSTAAPMRRDGPVEDSRELRPRAENLAAFLRALRDEHPGRYQRIRETVQIIAPFFDDFLLDVRHKGKAQHVRLEWRQRGSTFPYQPWQLSDGTIRFIALVTALLQPEAPAMLIVDEPELGLHPVALRVLAALMHEVSAQTQLVVSTQSPLFVDLFEPEDVVVVRRSGAESTFERLVAADLERWLDEYTLGDLMRKNVVETGP